MDESLTFSQALEALDEGKIVRRYGWSPIKNHLRKGTLQWGASTRPVLVLAVAGDFVPWDPDQVDITTGDWNVIG